MVVIVRMVVEMITSGMFCCKPDVCRGKGRHVLEQLIFEG